MRLSRIAIILLGVFCLVGPTFAQPATSSPFDGTRLKPMKLVYETDVTTADSSGKNEQISSLLTLDTAHVDGRPAWKLDVEGNAHDVDVWDHTTLEAITRTITFGPSRIVVDHQSGTVNVTVDGSEPEEYTVKSKYPVVSDGMLNYFALGTLPLKIGFTTRYNSFVRREKTVLTHLLDVVRDTTVTVPAGTFETYVVTERILGESDSTSGIPMWYVMKESPRLVAKLDAPLPNGGTAVVELKSLKIGSH